MKHPLPKAILIDLDDTIISYDQGVDTDACWRRSILAHVQEDKAAQVDDMISAIKERAKWHWSDPERHRIGRQDLATARQDIIATAFLKWEMDDPGVARNIAISFGEERERALTIFADSVETINQLRTRGFKLALVTNGNAKVQWSKIHRFELSGLFDCIAVEGDLGFGKPDERVYQHVLEQLGVTAEEAWMVGDNFEWEVVSPQRLGIKGIWVDHKGMGVTSEESPKPFMIIKSLGDLLSAL